MNANILIVDDDSLVIEFLEDALKSDNYRLVSARSAEQALLKMKESSFHLVLTDIKMGGMDGIELLSKIKETSPETQVLVMTAYGSVETAVKSMKLGAYDFIMKPMSPEAVEHRVNKALEKIALERENKALKQDIFLRHGNIVGKSRAMNKVFELIKTAAPTVSTVLITGESGTGKELIARALHFESERRDGPFVKLNCAALNQNLIESELFGHERGAFTGAITARSGRFELASGGSLLLDEISEMPVETQAKLLRVLQEREIEKVGSSMPVSIDVRIIASSNRDLRLAVREKLFRADLYYRLNVIPIEIPPLRERMEDIPLLVEHFISKYCEMNKRPRKSLDEGLYKRFMNYNWPGNIRELENFVERAVVVSKGVTITAQDIPEETFKPFFQEPNGEESEILDGSVTLHDAERILIMKALDRFSGNRTQAADSLGVSTRTIRNKLKEYRISSTASDEDDAE